MKKVIVVLSMLLTIAFVQTAAAQEEGFVGDPVVYGNGCPEGSYMVVASPDGSEVSILFSEFTAETSYRKMFDWANCNVALPINIPEGMTVGLLGVDYRGWAYIPQGGYGMFSREYFFAGQAGPRAVSYLKQNTAAEFYYEDDLAIASWAGCGDDHSVLARSNSTVFVKKANPYTGDEAYMSVFSEDWTYEIVFRLVWGWC